jgi:ribose 5-phosphate isomerase A
MSQQKAKEAAALKALEWVKPDMVIGLGSGSTAHSFLHFLNQRCKEGLSIQAVASSSETLKLAKQSGIPLLDPNTLNRVDLTVDGADEIDRQKRMIKGAGGALVREKILASMSREMIVIVDETKCVPILGKKPLPIEIIPFGAEATRLHLAAMGFKGVWRQIPSKTYYTTDNGNYILDLHFDELPDFLEKDDRVIRTIPGVVDTGFFFDVADRCIIGYSDGKVEIWN